MARLSGKLTAKSLGWDRNAIGAAVGKLGDNGRVHLGRIVGMVADIHTTVNETTGEIQKGLKGQFRGVSSVNEFTPVMVEATDDNGATIMKDGKPVMKAKRDANDVPVTVDTGKAITVTAGRCYLPGGLQDMIEGSLTTARASDDKATVQFGIDLFAIKAANAAGYSFDADTLIEAADVDPLDALLTSATSAAQAALPAPDEAPAVEPTKAATKAK